MTTLIKNSRSLLIGLAIVVTTYIFSLSAHAGLLYNGYAEIGFNLDNVAHVGGQGNGNGNGNGNGKGPGENSYSVILSGKILGSSIFSSGSGFADFFTSYPPLGDLSLDTSVYQYSESDGGSSGAGVASSYVETDFSISFQNNHQNPLKFDLSFLSYVSAFISNDGPLASGDDAGAYGEIQLFTDVNEILFSSTEAFIGGPMFSSEEVEKSLSFVLEGGASYEIYGIVYSDGNSNKSAITVPEPSIFWLMALSLIVFFITKNCRCSNTRVENSN